VALLATTGALSTTSCTLSCGPEWVHVTKSYWVAVAMQNTLSHGRPLSSHPPVNVSPTTTVGLQRFWAHRQLPHV